MSRALKLGLVVATTLAVALGVHLGAGETVSEAAKPKIDKVKLPGGRTLFIETKTEDGFLTITQTLRDAAGKNLGGTVTKCCECEGDSACLTCDKRDAAQCEADCEKELTCS